MNIRPIIDSPAKLAALFGERMVDMLDCIVTRYEKTKKHVHGFKWKAATLAFAFYNAALNGDAQFVCNFDNFLLSNQICIEQQNVEIDEAKKLLTWDVAAMMVETNQEIPQYVLDLVDGHIWMAYEVMADLTPSSTHPVARERVSHQPQPEFFAKGCTQPELNAKGGVQSRLKIETKQVNHNVPAFTDEQKQWMLNSAVESGDRQKLAVVQDLIKDNLLMRYFADDMKMLNEAGRRLQEQEREATLPTIGEYVAQKIVENQIDHVAEGAIGVYKNKQQ